LEFARTIGPDAAYMATEERKFDDIWDDNALKIELNHELFQVDADLFVEVWTVVYEGRVLLVGSVKDRVARQRAERIAQRIDGVKQVVNRIQVTDEGGMLAFAQDMVIEKRIQAELFFDSEVSSSNLRVRSVNQTVYLFGAAANQREIDRVVTIVRDVEEVREFENLIWLRQPSTSVARN
jgi:osmotically-inducible protein OsmY